MPPAEQYASRKLRGQTCNTFSFNGLNSNIIITCTLFKIFKATSGDNVSPCPIGKSYMSLDNKVETLSFQRETKQLLLKFKAQIL